MSSVDAQAAPHSGAAVAGAATAAGVPPRVGAQPGQGRPGATVEIEHETDYRYQSAVELAHHLALLRPRDEPGLQRVLDFALDIQPAPDHRRSDEDLFGNHRSCFSVVQPHRQLRVCARSRVELGVAPHVQTAPPWDEVVTAARYRVGAVYDPALDFRFASPLLPQAVLADGALQAYARGSFWPGRPLHEAALDLMHRVHVDWRYCPLATTVATPLLEAFARREGVCQDFAQLMIAMLRALGLSARYVSGYLIDDGSGAPLVGAQASHAWLAVACPQPGGRIRWLEFDPTNDCIASGSHVRLALGRDYGDVAPLRGVIRGGGFHTPAVRVQTRRAGSPARLAQSVHVPIEGAA